MNDADFTALLLTVKLATLSTAILLFIGTPLAWWLAKSRSKIKLIVETLVAMPLILPPTVIGFYMLIVLGSSGPLANAQLAFTFSGLVIGSVIYSLPFVVKPLQNSFESVDARYLDAAATLGASPMDTFFTIIAPLSKAGFLTAGVLGFAHTVGEFGVVLMIGGNIPGETQVLSIAIYDHVETMEYTQAHGLSAGLLIVSFITLLIVYSVNSKKKKDFI